MRTYRFHEEWVTTLPRRQAYDLLLDVERYPSWWPQIRAVASLGADHGLVACRSLLPFTLHLELTPKRREPEAGVLEVAIAGDLDGWARFELSDVAGGTSIAYDQQVGARGLLAARVLAPVARANHSWMMRGCKRGLETVQVEGR